MPQLRDITVHVTDSNGVEFEEWAVQHLRKQHKISAYIKAQSDTAFRVSVQANIPYTEYELPYEPSMGSDPYSLIYGGSPYAFQPRHGRSRKEGSSKRKHYRNESEGNPVDYDSRPKASSNIQSSPIRSQTSYPPSPPFDFLATLYLDGRRKAERKLIVYLDPNHEDFGPGGKSIFKSRWVQTQDGGIQEHAWVFNDIGIDTIFDKLVLANTGKDPGKDEIAIIAAMKGTGMVAEPDIDREARKKAGQIEVRISRVILGRKTVNYHFRPKHMEGENEDVDMDGADPELTHTTGFAPSKVFESNRMPVIDYQLYDNEEEVYATFKFFYRGQGTLEKLIPNFPRISKPAKKHQRKDGVFTSMTPLSILQGPKPTSKATKSPATTFEERLKKHKFDSETTIEFIFDDQNRRIQQVDDQRCSTGDQENKDAKKIVAANVDTNVKLDVTKATEAPAERQRPSSTSSMLCLAPSSEDDTDILNGLTSRHPSKSLLEIQRPKLIRDQSRAVDSSHSAEASAEVSETPASPSSVADASLDTHRPSLSAAEGFPNSSPSFLKLSSSQLMKLVNAEYRQDFSSDADDEHDVDESDLETHIGEDEHDKVGDDVLPSLDKDDEGLHKRLRGITIKGKGKRQYVGEGSVGDGKAEEGKHHSSEDGQSLTDDAGDEMSSGPAKSKDATTAGQGTKGSEQQSKRVKTEAEKPVYSW